MTIEYIKLGISLFNILLTVALFVYVRIDRTQRATVQSINELEIAIHQRMEAKEQRLHHLEAAMSRLPTREEIDRERDRFSAEVIRIHERVDEINKGIKDMQLMLGELYGMQKKRGNHGE